MYSGCLRKTQPTVSVVCDWRLLRAVRRVAESENVAVAVVVRRILEESPDIQRAMADDCGDLPGQKKLFASHC